MTRWRAEYDDGIWRFYRDGIELPFSLKGDIVVDALNKAEARITELEAENTALKQHPQPIEFWSDEKKELYRRNESRTIKSGREEERER